MRISIVNVNLVAHDATGKSIINQWRFFTQRGDDVVIFVEHPPVGVDDDVAQDVRVVNADQLNGQHNAHFRTSALYVYHYPSQYALVSSMYSLERGSVIFYFHNVTPPALWDNPDDHEFLRHSLEIVHSLAECADLIVTDSEYNAQDLITSHNCAEERIRVLPLAVPLGKFSYCTKSDELLSEYGLFGNNVLLFVGRQASNKRVDLVIRALADVRKTVPDVKLLIVGDHSGNDALQKYHDKLIALATELDVQEHVIFTGRVNELATYYHLADVYVTASQHEGFGVPLIEAMASGTPVVASNVTAHPWVLGDAGILVDGDDSEAYAIAITSLLTDTALYGGYVNKGIQRVQDFSLERYEASWFEIVSELVSWMPMEGYSRSVSMAKATLPDEVDVFSYGDVRIGDVYQLAALRDRAFSLHQNFQLTSKIPVLGRLIVWLRQNLTSHVTAEYAPLFQGQFALNRQMVRTFYALQTILGRRHAGQQATIAAQQSSIDTMSKQMTLMANEMQLMQMRLTLLQSQSQGQVDNQTLEAFQQELDRLSKSYAALRGSLESIPEANTKEA